MREKTNIGRVLLDDEPELAEAELCVLRGREAEPITQMFIPVRREHGTFSPGESFSIVIHIICGDKVMIWFPRRTGERKKGGTHTRYAVEKKKMPVNFLLWKTKARTKSLAGFCAFINRANSIARFFA
jgi:hypothetical protein